jgi:RHS repeat-associated protein
VATTNAANGWLAVPASGVTETDTGYDAAARPITTKTVYGGSVVTVGGVAMQTTTAYADYQMTVTPPAPAGTTTTITDEYGRTKEIDQAGPSGTVATKYTVDDHDRVTDILDANSDHTHYTYDALGRRLTVQDPDTGASSSVYDNDDNVIQATDAKNNMVNTTFDAVGRTTSVSLADGALGAWDLNESTASTGATPFSDSSSYGHTLYGYGTEHPGDPGPAAGLTATTFSGSAGYASTSGPVLDTTKSFSVAAWVKMASLPAGSQTMVVQQATTASGFYLEYNNGYWQFSRMNSDTTNPTGEAVDSDAAATTAWTHLVGTWDATTGKMTLYVNGVAQSATATDTSTFASNGPLVVGRNWYNGAAGNAFSGSLSMVRVYQNAATAAQAQQLSLNNSESGVPTPSQTDDYDSATAGKGLLASSSTSFGHKGDQISVPGYTALGQPTGKTWTIGSDEGALAGTYSETFGFDGTGRQNSIAYPAAGGLAAETVTSAWNTLGLATTVTGASTYVSGTSFAAAGQMSGRVFGASGTGQVTRTYGYDPTTQLLSTLSATASNGTGTPTVQNDTYSRNADGEVVSLTDGVSGQAQCYQYDSLSRMTDAFTANGSACSRTTNTFGPAPYDNHYTFDNINRIQTVTDNLNTANNKTFAYADPAHIHAPTGDGAGSSYTYNADGAMVSRTTPATGSQTLDWTPQQQLQDVTVGSNVTSDVYGPDGSRLIRHDPGGAAELFLDGEELALNGSTVTASRYYAAQNGAVVAERTPTTLTWLLSDAQGSAAIAVAGATGAATRQYYTPYGNQRGGNTLQSTTDHGYLGQVDDYGTGLLQDGARYYDPATGSFVSPDPINDSGPGQLNAYAYADDSPVTHADPSGLAADFCATLACAEETAGGVSCSDCESGAVDADYGMSIDLRILPHLDPQRLARQKALVNQILKPTKKSPDYTTQGALACVGSWEVVPCGGASVTRTRDGHKYLDLAVGAGTEGVSYESKVGYVALAPPGTNSDDTIDSFVSGWAVTGEVCHGVVMTCSDIVYGQVGQLNLEAFGYENGTGWGSGTWGGSVTVSYSIDATQVAKVYKSNNWSSSTANGAETVGRGALHVGETIAGWLFN